MPSSSVKPTRLEISVTSATGNEVYRWDSIAEQVKWSNLIPGGFGTLQLTLRRSTKLAGFDVQYLNDIKIRDEGQNLLFEGRIEDINPFSSGNDSGFVIEAVGYKTLLDDNIYYQSPIKTDVLWEPRALTEYPGVGRPDIIGLSTGQIDASDLTKIGWAMTLNTAVGSRLDVTGQLNPSPSGVTINTAYFDYAAAISGGNFWSVNLWGWVPGTGYVVTGFNGNVGNGTFPNQVVTLPLGTRWVLFALSTTVGIPAGSTFSVYNFTLGENYCPLSNLQAGITVSNVAGKTITAQDAIAELLSWSYQMSFDPSQIQSPAAAAYTLPQFSYFENPTKQSDVLNDIFAFLPSWWGVYDNKTLWVRDFDATRTDWVVSLAQGVQMDLQPTASEAFSGAVIKFTTAGGKPAWRSVTDTTPDSIFQNVYGSPQRRRIFDLGTVGSTAVVDALAPVIFPENSYETQRGTITIPAGLLVYNGNLGGPAPAWRIRAGDNIRVSDAVTTRALYGNTFDRQSNFIIRTVDVDWDSQSVTVGVDNSQSSMTQLFARLAAVNQSQFGQ